MLVQVATAAALCAYKLRRPVRMYLNRNTDMVMIGGRHPVKAHYSVGFKSDGKITALHLDLLINAGISPDASPMIPGTIICQEVQLGCCHLTSSSAKLIIHLNL